MWGRGSHVVNIKGNSCSLLRCVGVRSPRHVTGSRSGSRDWPNFSCGEFRHWDALSTVAAGPLGRGRVEGGRRGRLKMNGNGFGREGVLHPPQTFYLKYCYLSIGLSVAACEDEVV